MFSTLALTLVASVPAAAPASTPAAQAVVQAAEAPSASHTDFVIGAGMLTSGIGVSVGHRTDAGLRVEGAAGTMVLGSGFSIGAGGSFIVLDTGSHRLEVPVMFYGLVMSCGVCGTDSSSTSTTVMGGATGLDWIWGRTATESGLIVTLRAGVGTATKTVNYDDSTYTQLMPVAQLGAGWAF